MTEATRSWMRTISGVAVSALLVIVLALVGCASNSSEQESDDSSQNTVEATLPSLQPADHVNRWVEGGSTSEACTTCHKGEGQDGEGAVVPDTHYTDGDPAKPLMADYAVCETCHPAFQE